jgi:hypothetical protein
MGYVWQLTRNVENRRACRLAPSDQVLALRGWRHRLLELPAEEPPVEVDRRLRVGFARIDPARNAGDVSVAFGHPFSRFHSLTARRTLSRVPAKEATVETLSARHECCLRQDAVVHTDARRTPAVDEPQESSVLAERRPLWLRLRKLAGFLRSVPRWLHRRLVEALGAVVADGGRLAYAGGGALTRGASALCGADAGAHRAAARRRGLGVRGEVRRDAAPAAR